MATDSEPLTKFLDAQLWQGPLCYRQVYTKSLLPASVEALLLVRNLRYGSYASAQSAAKPISKIVEEQHTAFKTPSAHERATSIPSELEDEAASDLFLHLHADCIAVEGAHNSAIYDLTRSELAIIPTAYYRVLRAIVNKRISLVRSAVCASANAERIWDFVAFLFENEYVCVLGEPEDFPPISENWATPGELHNAIIDVNSIEHDFRAIFSELDLLGCRFVQIRQFSNLLSLSRLSDIARLAVNTSIEGLEFITKFETGVQESEYVSWVRETVLVTSLVIHSSPVERAMYVPPVEAPAGSAESIYPEILFVRQSIDSHTHCGFINLKTLSQPSVPNYLENRLYNGCLNRKISIDERGIIRNCPSMRSSFGRIGENSLRLAVAQEEFRSVWSIRKDQIATCKNCEYRYVCSDCRAYLDDRFAKPLKCGYDPYTATWSTVEVARAIISTESA